MQAWNKEFCSSSDVDLSSFSQLCAQAVQVEDYPFARSSEKNILIYEVSRLSEELERGRETEVKSELHRALRSGPGVVAIQGAFSETAVVDRATRVFQEIIAEEKRLASHRGDHFAKPGDNERVWNALQKFCEKDPEGFVEYYDNLAIGLVAEAWLGPYFQMTSQVNIVKPGGQAQKPHRDYHLGFQEDEIVGRFPVSVQVASQLLTLQGAVAHTDMSVASGPTKLLPFSQQYPLGYLAWRNPEFMAFFEEHAVQLPLQKGDAVFFSPALFHAAGTNQEASDRIANLLQVSAAFGKTMETVNWSRIAKAVYPVLLQKQASGIRNPEALRWLGGSVADGYSFPTNLDADPPIGGSAPETPQALISRALSRGLSAAEFDRELDCRLACRQA